MFVLTNTHLTATLPLTATLLGVAGRTQGRGTCQKLVGIPWCNSQGSVTAAQGMFLTGSLCPAFVYLCQMKAVFIYEGLFVYLLDHSGDARVNTAWHMKAF